MIIVRLIGGLGNQMFQYAFGKALAKKHGAELKIDTSFLTNKAIKGEHFVQRNYSLDIFNIDEKQASTTEVNHLTKHVNNDFVNNLLNRAFGYKKSYIKEPHYHFSQLMLNVPDNILAEGYWQSEKYFADATAELRIAFTFRKPPVEACVPLVQEIDQSESVCVHVRRGDFLTNSNHGFCGLPYYKEAEGIMRSKLKDPRYFVFSDEIEWCRENMGFLPGAIFVSKDLAGYKDQDHLRMMSHCKHFIIPNSSFAWWAAWLGKRHDSIVTAPDHWYKAAPIIKDVYQDNWIII